MIYLELFYTFFMIGAVTFGGGYAMIAVIQEQVVSKGWLDVEQFLNFVAVSESTPGPIAINMATYIGSDQAGILGSACATLGVVLPSFVVILIVAKCYQKFCQSKAVKGCMSGLKPAVVGLIAAAMVPIALTVFVPNGWSMEVLKTPAFYASLALSAGVTVLAFKKVHPILLVCLSAVVGILLGSLGLLPGL